MSVPIYPDYKESGVAWLGRVPSHWGILQARRMFAVRSEPALADDQMLTASQKFGVLFQSDFIEREGRRVVEVILGKDNLKHVEPNDFIISMRSFQGGLEWCKLRGSTSFHYVMVTPIKHAHPPFFAHLFKSISYIHALRATTDLIRDGQELRYSNFVQVDLPVVPLAEQQAIANFLDLETAKIDGLVAEQERLIALLKEKRQAVISHAVTKGLNPNAPMKDSSIEWLGQIPAHWVARPLKSLAVLIDGDRSNLYPSDQDIVASGIPFLSSKNIIEYRFDDSEVRFITDEKFDALSRGKILDGDLAITVRGTIGHLAIFDAVSFGYQTAFINAQMMIIRPINVSAIFILMISQSTYWQTQLDRASYGTAQQQLSNSVLANITVAVPPENERIEIEAFLKFEADRFDVLIHEATGMSKLLQERRAALISAAVTGKIDVRTAVAREAELATA